MYFDKPATASAPARVKRSPLLGRPWDGLFLHHVCFFHMVGAEQQRFQLKTEAASAGAHNAPLKDRHQHAACHELRKASVRAPTQIISPGRRQSKPRKAPIALPSHRITIIKISLYMCIKPYQ